MTPAPGPPPLAVDAGLRSLLRLGSLRAAPVAVQGTGAALGDEIEETAAALPARYAGRSPAEIEALAPARQLYRAFGIDPTRTRPSSEALLRRVLAGKPFPRISSAVDLCNLCALRFLLPIGLYDLDLLRGRPVLRRGAPGESYVGIRKDDVHLEGRPVLADDGGPFGNPTSDSLRTSVTDRTRALWMVIFAPASFPVSQLERHVNETRVGIERHLAPAGASVAVDTTLL